MEFELIRLMTKRYGPFKAAAVGPGDDCAVLKGQGDRLLLFTTDTIVEGVHFELEMLGWRALGDLALAVNLSDVAAMAGEPLAAVVSTAFPENVSREDAAAFADGLGACAKRYGVEVVGGDTVRSPLPVVTVALLGTVAPDRLCLRSAARPGEGLFVTGSLGDREGARRMGRHLPVAPRLAEASALATAGVRCMIDISDGLSGDLRHVLAASGVGAVVDAAAVPAGQFAAKAASAAGESALSLALGGGDDYELLFTASETVAKAFPPIARKLGTPITLIGEITSSRKALLRDADGALQPFPEGGWDHFKK